MLIYKKKIEIPVRKFTIESYNNEYENGNLTIIGGVFFLLFWLGGKKQQTLNRKKNVLMEPREGRLFKQAKEWLIKIESFVDWTPPGDCLLSKKSMK